MSSVEGLRISALPLFPRKLQWNKCFYGTDLGKAYKRCRDERVRGNHLSGTQMLPSYVKFYAAADLASLECGDQFPTDRESWKGKELPFSQGTCSKI